MHCPSCARDNAPTTRFCAGCGAVLREDAAHRFARRGLKRARPAKIQPVSAPPAPGRRPAFMLAAFAVAATIALYASYFARPSSVVARETPPLVPLPVKTATRSVPTAADSTAPRLEPSPEPWVSPVGPRQAQKRVTGAPIRPRAHERETRVAEPIAAFVERAGDGPVHSAAETVGERVIVDRWTAVEQEIAQCGERNLFERLFCVERVRLANCTGHWGSVPSCPGAQVVDYPR